MARKQMTKPEFADYLIGTALQTFQTAYKLHVKGHSVEAILITHDIMAANANVEKVIADLHRQTIRSACQAQEAGVPFGKAIIIAHYRMRQWVQEALQNEP